MSVLLAIAALTTLATQGAPETPPCPDGTTQDFNNCFSARLASADADRLRYGAAVRVRLKGEAAQASDGDKSAANASQAFDQAEVAWAKYRDAECGAVYAYWAEGTIRDEEELGCEIKLTRLHTHTIWLEWLTYMDSTPPILPEPPVPPDD